MPIGAKKSFWSYWWCDPRLEKQKGNGMRPSFIITNFIMVMKMDALDVVWQLTISFKTICNER